VRRLDLENLHNPILRSLFYTTGINVPTPMSVKLIKTLNLLIERESGGGTADHCNRVTLPASPRRGLLFRDEGGWISGSFLGATYDIVLRVA
jgi:hypothetical protein